MAEAKDSPLNNVEDTDFETRLAAVEILLNYGAHVNAKTQAQETPLHFAVRNNCLKVAQLLVEYEANVYEVNQDRRTPLHVCAEFGHSKMAELLLKHCEQKANAVCKDYKIPAFEEINAIKMAKLLFNYCRYQADLHVSLDQVIKEFRSYPFRYRSRSYESYEDICYELNSNPRLKDCRQFWFWLHKALYKYYSVPCDFVTNGQHSAFENDDIEIHLLKRIQEMTVNKTFEDNATSLHRAVQSCRPSLFNDFQLQTADEKRLNNRVKNPNEQLEGEAVISSGEEIRLTELLNSWGKHPNQFDTRINARVFSHYATSKAMSYLYNDCYNGVNQSKNLRIKAYLKSHIMTKNDKTLVKNDKEEIVRSSVNKASGRDLFTFILYHADEYEVTSMRHLYVESFIEQDQAKTHSMTENVKCYVNMKDSEGYDVLLKAVECNRPDVLQLLMMNGAETCSITSQGYAALHIAVNSIHNASKTSNPIEMVKVLLTSGEFSVNALSFKAETPLHLATSNCGCGLSGQNLEELQRRRKIQDSVISLLLESKANVSQQDCEGLTPLMIASERGCYHIVKILIDWTSVKVDLDARDKYGETALIKAARMYHTKIVEELVNSGAQIDLQEYRGFTALHAALHDPNEFTSLFQLFENESQDIGLYDNEVNEKVYSRVEDAALISATTYKQFKR